MIRNRSTIADVAHLVGLNPWTLRRLEKLGRIPAARRDPLAGVRIYTDADIEHIRAALAQLEVSHAGASA